MPDQTANRLKKNIPNILNLWEKRTWAEVKASNTQETLVLRDSLPDYLMKMAEALSGTIIRTDESRLNDRIWVVSKLGQGAAFHLVLPKKTQNLEKDFKCRPISSSSDHQLDSHN